MKTGFGYCLLLVGFLAACSPQQYLGKQARKSLLQTAPLDHAHVGISVYDPLENKYLFNYQADKYFVPASNTKIVTCYAGMKYLGDSLTGIHYIENDTALLVIPAGDPTLLHPDFLRQPVIDFLKAARKKIYITDQHWQSDALGAGWSWGDYNASYMPERSPLPVYGNTLRWIQENSEQQGTGSEFEPTPFIYSIPEIDWKVRFNTDTARRGFYVRRHRDENTFVITQGPEKRKEQQVPFITNSLAAAIELLADTIGKAVHIATRPADKMFSGYSFPGTVYSQPTDSMLKILMHRSDNFFAEQTLLMVSNSLLQVMNDDKVIDSLLQTDFKDLPQMPRWADGSGLSRYNLFTPQDFVTILQKMRNEFGMDRIKAIFPTGGRGTLTGYYRQDSGYIYAKTGTLSGVVALSGYLVTRKNRTLIFSVLVNNHNGSATAVRRAVEAFLVNIRNRY
jgi:D-alanyl-D-alanine carboxypeptidase/D-alanyl-D-alanine-endopeptidase (penicillin-binding protein 4)